MTTYTESPVLPDHILTEREFDASDIAELQAELDEAEREAEAQREYVDAWTDYLRATSEWNYR